MTTIALIASRAHRTGSDCPLVRFVRDYEPYLREVLKPRILAVKGSYDAIRAHGLLHGYDGLEAMPPAALGGLVRMVARVASDDPAHRIDQVVYFTDPLDPTSLYPESLALKRECVVNARPFLSTEAGIREWFALDWRRRAPENAPPVAIGMLARSTVALVAHDPKKAEMLAFAAEHFAVLDSFGARLATGTTGALLNGELPERLRRPGAGLDGVGLDGVGPAGPGSGGLHTGLAELGRLLPGRRRPGERWVQPMLSGPLGGDAQIAELVVEGRCQYVLFFEDPFVPREHEADIQLMERAARIPGIHCRCLHDPRTAAIWADNLAAVAGL